MFSTLLDSRELKTFGVSWILKELKERYNAMKKPEAL
jgi:hypothetical protein